MSGDQITVDGVITGPHLSGLQGPAGANGRTILNGNLAPLSGLGSIGDFYINTSTWKIYGPKIAALSNPWGSGVQLNSAVDGLSRVVMGFVSGDGTIWSGTGNFQVVKGTDFQGHYNIQFATAFNTPPICLCAINSLYENPENHYGGVEATYCRMPTDDPLTDRWERNVFIRDTNDLAMNAAFSFICAEP
jgi:hypothetical protein